MDRFEELFFEESFEGLEILEAGLLALADGGGRSTVDDIFRAAHSIKGGSGTFGFSDITGLTHFLETLLDDLRSGHREPGRALTQLLLEGVDGLRYLLETRKEGQQPDPNRIAAVLERLAQTAQAGPDSDSSVADAPEAVESAAAAMVEWAIDFRPQRHLLRTGNEPLRILDELAGLGELRGETDTSTVPALASLEPEDLYLSWRLHLRTAEPERKIREIFAWVEDDCDLSITAATAETAAPATVPPAGTPPPETAQTGTAQTGTAQTGTAPAAASPAPADKAGAPPSDAGTRRGSTEGGSMRVSTEKVDAVINLVGELVITQSMLNCLGEQFEMSMMDRLRDGLAQLDRNTRELQETVLKMRMLPMSFCFQRFPRLVHDVSEKLGKKVALRLVGEGTEIDKTVLERISDPLVHLVRNALDHGVETPDRRRLAGKPECGTLTMQASHEGGNIVILVSDDGAGLDPERILAKAVERGLVSPTENLSEEKIQQLIFLPGFSTAAAVTELSGRGVGMDVVRRNIEELGGSVEISSRHGAGTRFRIRLPLTLSILDGLLVRVGREAYVIPLTSIVESVQLRKGSMHELASGQELYHFREDYIPLIRLQEVIGQGGARQSAHGAIDLSGAAHAGEPLLVVVETPSRRAGLLVDDLLGQQQVVIKSLEENFYKVEGISGATILGDGQVAMILDLEGIVRLEAARMRRLNDLREQGERTQYEQLENLAAEKENHDVYVS